MKAEIGLTMLVQIVAGLAIVLLIFVVGCSVIDSLIGDEDSDAYRYYERFVEQVDVLVESDRVEEQTEMLFPYNPRANGDGGAVTEFKGTILAISDGEFTEPIPPPGNVVASQQGKLGKKSVVPERLNDWLDSDMVTSEIAECASCICYSPENGYRGESTMVGTIERIELDEEGLLRVVNRVTECTHFEPTVHFAFQNQPFMGSTTDPNNPAPAYNAEEAPYPNLILGKERSDGKTEVRVEWSLGQTI